MGSLTLTAKIKLYPSQEQAATLQRTLSVLRDAQNFVSAFVFEHSLTHYSKLNQALYYPVREQFGLRSQMTQST